MSCCGITLKGAICGREHWLTGCCGNCKDHCCRSKSHTTSYSNNYTNSEPWLLTFPSKSNTLSSSESPNINGNLLSNKSLIINDNLSLSKQHIQSNSNESTNITPIDNTLLFNKSLVVNGDLSLSKQHIQSNSDESNNITAIDNTFNSNFIFKCTFTTHFIEKIKFMFNDPQIFHADITIPFNMLILLEHIIDGKYVNKNLDIFFDLLKIMDSFNVKKEFIIKLFKYHKLNFYVLCRKMIDCGLSITMQKFVSALYIADIDEKRFFTFADTINIIDNKTDIVFKKMYSTIDKLKNKKYKEHYFKLKKDLDDLKK
jgi:hypothetical protein